MEWTDIPTDPKAALTTLAMLAITTFLVPAGKAKLEELRARAKAVAHDLALRYAREAVRWAANEARRLGLHGDDVERIALQHLRSASKGVAALKAWTGADLLGVLRAAFEEWRLEVKRFDAEVAAIGRDADAALARLNRAGAAADALNATRAPEPFEEPTNPGSGE